MYKPVTEAFWAAGQWQGLQGWDTQGWSRCASSGVAAGGGRGCRCLWSAAHSQRWSDSPAPSAHSGAQSPCQSDPPPCASHHRINNTLLTLSCNIGHEHCVYLSLALCFNTVACLENTSRQWSSSDQSKSQFWVLAECLCNHNNRIYNTLSNVAALSKVRKKEKEVLPVWWVEWWRVWGEASVCSKHQQCSGAAPPLWWSQQPHNGSIG